MNKLYGLITVDLMMILIPVLIYPVDEKLVGWVGVILATLMTITILTFMGTDKDSATIKKVMDEHKTRPTWWTYYDLSTDLLVVLAWASIGNYLIGILVILMKAFILIKIPDYFKRNTNENSED